MKYRSLFLKIFFCFWLAAAAMIAALNLMLWFSFAQDPNPGAPTRRAGRSAEPVRGIGSAGV